MTDDRVKKNVALPKERFEEFNRWCSDEGRIQYEALGRVLTWFMRQDKVVWAAILNGVDDRIKPAFAKVLREIADEYEQPSGRASESGNLTYRPDDRDHSQAD